MMAYKKSISPDLLFIGGKCAARLRIANRKIAERWATLTPPREV